MGFFFFVLIIFTAINCIAMFINPHKISRDYSDELRENHFPIIIHAANFKFYAFIVITLLALISIINLGHSLSTPYGYREVNLPLLLLNGLILIGTFLYILQSTRKMVIDTQMITVHSLFTHSSIPVAELKDLKITERQTKHDMYRIITLTLKNGKTIEIDDVFPINIISIAKLLTSIAPILTENSDSHQPQETPHSWQRSAPEFIDSQETIKFSASSLEFIMPLLYLTIPVAMLVWFVSSLLALSNSGSVIALILLIFVPLCSYILYFILNRDCKITFEQQSMKLENIFRRTKEYHYADIQYIALVESDDKRDIIHLDICNGSKIRLTPSQFNVKDAKIFEKLIKSRMQQAEHIADKCD